MIVQVQARKKKPVETEANAHADEFPAESGIFPEPFTGHRATARTRARISCLSAGSSFPYSTGHLVCMEVLLDHIYQVL